MKIKTVLTKDRLKNHFTYHFWIYLLAAAGCIFGWNLLYTMTEYRSPEEKRIDVYIQGSVVSEERTDSFLKTVWHAYVPEMETVETVYMLQNSQDYYSNVQLTVYLMAREGDIYMLSSSDFKSFASQGMFLDLSDPVADGSLNVDGLDLSAGYVALIDDNGLPSKERSFFGIPASSLKGLSEEMGLDTSDLIIGVTVFNGNQENVIAFLNGLLQSGRRESQ